MSNSKVPKRVVSLGEWESQLDGTSGSAAAAATAALTKRATHDLVMEHLIREGYHDVALAFAAESDTPLPSGTGAPPLAAERMAIRKALHAGDITGGIEKLNDLDPELLERDGRLFYHLQQQKLLELIRAGQWAQALLFAQQTLAPRASSDVAFLAEMEQIMALAMLPVAAMAVPPAASASATAMDTGNGSAATPAAAPAAAAPSDPMAALAQELLGVGHRQRVADDVNDAILTTSSAAAASALSLSGTMGAGATPTAKSVVSASSSATAAAPASAAAFNASSGSNSGGDSRLVCALRRLLYEQRRAAVQFPHLSVPTLQPQHLVTATLTPAAATAAPPIAAPRASPSTPMISPPAAGAAPLPTLSPPLTPSPMSGV